jgi:hypothetical protein
MDETRRKQFDIDLQAWQAADGWRTSSVKLKPLTQRTRNSQN